MDATCAIQDSIHAFSLVHKCVSRILGTYHPDWSYINFKSTTTIDDSILDSAEYVFFFTDMLKHHVYYRFINLAKQKRVPFGYIGSSNIEKCIKQIAEEMERR